MLHPHGKDDADGQSGGSSGGGEGDGGGCGVRSVASGKIGEGPWVGRARTTDKATSSRSRQPTSLFLYVALDKVGRLMNASAAYVLVLYVLLVCVYTFVCMCVCLCLCVSVYLLRAELEAPNCL